RLPSAAPPPRENPNPNPNQPPAPAPAASLGPGDAARARAEAKGRIEGLPAADKDLNPAQKALREVWTERLALVDEWEKAVKSRHDAEHPEPPPDREVAQRKSERDQHKAMLDQLARTPDSVVPELFRLPP